jgi:NADPH-dependent F420 reductase
MTIRKLIFILSLLTTAPLLADTIAVIGTGNVGMALGTEFAQQGHTIVYGSRNPLGLKALDVAKKSGKNASTATPGEAAERAQIVVLAVPGMFVKEVVEGLGDLSGKLIIDATNPLLRDEAMHFTYGVRSSNGEIVQAAAPEALVVKAFNTISWQSMIDPQDADEAPYVPIVGNDKAAKDRVAKMVGKMGLRSIDLGPITVAHWTEYSVVVALNNQLSERENFDLVFRKID